MTHSEQSVPTELNEDLNVVLSFAEACYEQAMRYCVKLPQTSGYTTMEALKSNLGWEDERIRLALVCPSHYIKPHTWEHISAGAVCQERHGLGRRPGIAAPVLVSQLRGQNRKVICLEFITVHAFLPQLEHGHVRMHGHVKLQSLLQLMLRTQ